MLRWYAGNDRHKRTSCRYRMSTKRRIPFMNNWTKHWTLKLAISDKNGRTLIWEATLLVLYGMTPIDNIHFKEWRSHDSQCVNMSLHLNILDILFDSCVCCYALFMFIVLYFKSLNCNYRSCNCVQRDSSYKTREATPSGGKPSRSSLIWNTIITSVDEFLAKTPLVVS